MSVLQRLEAGEAPADVFAGRPLDFVAAVALEALGDDESLGPKLVQARPERPKLVAAVSEPALAGLFPKASRPTRLALSAGLLQILNAWDASHEAAQEAEDLGERRFSAYWHGVAHRREPDAGNASYWFRRVGRHPLFPTLAESAEPLLTEGTRRVVAGGSWDPFAMIDVCTRSRPGTDDERAARRLQRLEMAILLKATAEAAIA
ncbi:hypothetical protein [Paludisphaera rhizosphaerae]|uniref:hypothetical protein n=1 Tax=Paludisphaera rhizosphaerae TaxID=2711216 RepID=UPI0013EA5E0A|nr:hypothetical protein [Paludisphaera rhizosphaerae]